MPMISVRKVKLINVREPELCTYVLSAISLKTPMATSVLMIRTAANTHKVSHLCRKLTILVHNLRGVIMAY